MAVVDFPQPPFSLPSTMACADLRALASTDMTPPRVGFLVAAGADASRRRGAAALMMNRARGASAAALLAFWRSRHPRSNEPMAHRARVMRTVTALRRALA